LLLKLLLLAAGVCLQLLLLEAVELLLLLRPKLLIFTYSR
jgi:hypothetical protein